MSSSTLTSTQPLPRLELPPAPPPRAEEVPAETGDVDVVEEARASVFGLAPALHVCARRAPGPEQLAAATSLFETFAGALDLATAAVVQDGYADFVDTFGYSKRLRPEDAKAAALLVAVSMYSVLEDVRDGVVSGSLAELVALAKERTRYGVADVERRTREMLADPSWRRATGRVETPADTGSVFSRSVVSLAVPEQVALGVFDSAIGQRIVAGALRVASAPAAERTHVRAEADLDVAYALYHAREIPAVSGAALPAIVSATGVSPVAALEPVGRDITVADLEDAREAGTIDGFIEVDGERLTYRLKSPEEIAREVQAKLQVGLLDHLSVDARVQLGVLLGPEDAPGADLAARIASEGGSRAWREFAGAVVEVAAVCFVSGGVGAVVEGVAVGARVSSLAVRAARFVATSATFTTVLGAKTGRLSAGDYARDALIFGALAQASRLAPLAAKLVGGSSVTAQVSRLALAHGVMIGGGAGVMTGAEVVERLAAGQDPRWRAVGQAFLRNLAMVATLHGVQRAAAQLHAKLAPETAAAKELVRIERAQARSVEATTRAMRDAEAALERGDVAAAEDAASRLEAEHAKANRWAAELVVLAKVAVGTDVAADIAAQVARPEAGFAISTRARVELQKALEAAVGRDGLAALAAEVGGARLEALQSDRKSGRALVGLYGDLGTADGRAKIARVAPEGWVLLRSEAAKVAAGKMDLDTAVAAVSELTGIDAPTTKAWLRELVQVKTAAIQARAPKTVEVPPEMKEAAEAVAGRVDDRRLRAQIQGRLDKVLGSPRIDGATKTRVLALLDTALGLEGTKLDPDGVNRWLANLQAPEDAGQVAEFLAELEHAVKVVRSGEAKVGSTVHLSVKPGMTVELEPGVKVTIEMASGVNEGDVVYLDRHGVVRMDEVKSTVNALVTKLKEDPEYLERFGWWQGLGAPGSRRARVVVMDDKNAERLTRYKFGRNEESAKELAARLGIEVVLPGTEP